MHDASLAIKTDDDEMVLKFIENSCINKPIDRELMNFVALKK